MKQPFVMPWTCGWTSIAKNLLPSYTKLAFFLMDGRFYQINLLKSIIVPTTSAELAERV